MVFVSRLCHLLGSRVLWLIQWHVGPISNSSVMMVGLSRQQRLHLCCMGLVMIGLIVRRLGVGGEWVYAGLVGG